MVTQDLMTVLYPDGTVVVVPREMAYRLILTGEAKLHIEAGLSAAAEADRVAETYAAAHPWIRRAKAVTK